MSDTQEKQSTTSQTIVPTIVTFGVSDPEVLQAMSEYAEGPPRTQFLATALKVGVLSLKAARGTLDSDTLRRESDRLMEELGGRLNTWRGKLEERVSSSLSHYFDPKSGTFMERVDRLTKDDGDLAGVITRQVGEAQSGLSRMFEQFIGENSQIVKLLDAQGDNQFVTALRAALDAAVEAQNKAILEQFSLDNRSGALSRFMGELASRHGDLRQAMVKDMGAVVSEFDLNREDSALSRLVKGIDATKEAFTSELSLDNEGSALNRIQRTLLEHQESVMRHNLELVGKVDAVLQAVTTKKMLQATGPQHGLEFEACVGERLSLFTQGAGDVLQAVGSSTGLISHCKVGDFVITIGPEKVASGARIVVEAKESASYDLAKTLEEADVARRNRQAGVCVFVHSTKTAQDSIPVFQRYGHDLVVRWNAEDESGDSWLQAALMVAVAMSSKAAQHGKAEAASFGKIDKAIERIRRLVSTIDDITTSANTARTATNKIIEGAASTKEGLEQQIKIVAEEFLLFKDAAAEG